MEDPSAPFGAHETGGSARRIGIRAGSIAAALALIVGVASAHAGPSGGIGGDADAPIVSEPDSEQAINAGTAECPNKQLGRRSLSLGDCGADVQTLNWILKSKRYREAPLTGEFQRQTGSAVRAFQRDTGLGADGVVDRPTTAALVAGMASQTATWYGPGFFGNETACGQMLTPRTLGVAHRTLPCGSRVVLRYRGRYVRTTVIDRGPFANRAKWDLTQATARQLGFRYTDEIRAAKLTAR